MIKTLIISAWVLFHPVHVTLTSIDLVPGTDSLKVFVRMYYDDFLRDFRLFDTTEALAGNPGAEKPFPGSLMNNYINGKVNITINNKLLKGKLLNLALADNEISINMLFRVTGKPRVISVRNLIMTGMYSDQANMTMIRINNFEEGVRLTPEKNSSTFNLK